MTAKLVTIKAPITVLFEGEYRPPGTLITLSEDEANSLISRHGVFDEDPASKNPLKGAKERDEDSILALNTQHHIHCRNFSAVRSNDEG